MSAKPRKKRFVEPICGCVGCGEQAEAIIRHPIHGHRTVCGEHANPHPLVQEL